MAAACTHPGHTHLEQADRHGTVRIALAPLRAAAVPMLVIATAWTLLPLHPPVLCPLRRFTGVPCPFCGMTRGVVALVHGDLDASLAFNPGALLVVAFALVLLAAWRWRYLIVPTWSLFALFALLWAYQLFKYTTGRPL